jgi:hypothetical protein
MATIRPVPTLSSKGYVYTTEEKVDHLLAYALLSNASQTPMFRGQIMSFQELIQRTQGDRIALQSQADTAFNNYFSRYFDDVSTEIAVLDDPDDGRKLRLRIYISVRDNGRTVSVGMIAQFMDGIFKQVVRINEGTD